MVSKKQKIRSLFMDEEEIADLMLEEDAKKKKRDWKRIAHYFRIHTYDKIIRRRLEKKVVKCKYCKKLHLTYSFMPLENVILFLSLLFCGLYFGVYLTALWLYSRNLSLELIILIIPGWISFYWMLKRLLEKLWMA